MNFISFKTLRSLCIDLIIFFVPLLILWTFLPFIIKIIFPFVLGYILYLSARPLNRLLRKKLPPALCAFFSLFVISALLFFILRSLLIHLVGEIADFSLSSGLYEETVPFISRKITSITKSSPDVFSGILRAFHSQLENVLLALSSWLLNFARNIPAMLIRIFISFFTAFFLLKDDGIFYSSLHKFFGRKFCMRFTEIKNSVLDAVFSYLKAQLIIEAIIFTVLFIGFNALNQKYSLLLAFFTAIVDIFPILGTGAVLVPMSIFHFLLGSRATGWGILVLYGVAMLTRQLCEPKIIGRKLGIHPLITIFAIYSGMTLFGITGLILGPLVAIFIKNIFFQKNRNFS